MASQIAAGEVIERPASVVKELVENAIDAGATRIRVELEQGGTELVQITDDGSGIPEQELPLAITAHATSKIETTSDLDRIATMGFRGEALASIASVSRLVIRSRPANADAAAELTIAGDVGDLRAGGARYEIAPASGPVGTRISVRNLFFATPARRKFLKTPQTERGRCLDALRDLALAHPSVGFTLVSEGRTTLELASGQSLRERALEILGRDLEPQLLEVHADQFTDERGLSLWGLVGTPSIARATASHQRVFVNGRAIRDRSIQHALKEAYRGLMEHTRHPTAAILIEMAPEAVDVNVHPAKSEVRFRDPGLIHSTVLRAVREALRVADLTPSAVLPGGNSSDLPGAGSLGSVPREPTARPLVQTSPVTGFFDRPSTSRPAQRFDYESVQRGLRPDPIPSNEAPDALPSPGTLRPDPLAGALQVHNSYIVSEDEQGVVIIDQHALHERVMFETISARLEQGPLQTQRLLVPETVDLSERQMEMLPDMTELLERLGIEAAPIGPKSIAVHAFPSLLFERKVQPVGFVQELFDAAERSGLAPGSEEALRSVVDMMSCKAAVKAGDSLQPTELARLLELRDEVERSSSCPHGRPTSVRLSLADLEKLFHRR